MNRIVLWPSLKELCQLNVYIKTILIQRQPTSHIGARCELDSMRARVRVEVVDGNWRSQGNQGSGV